MTLPDGLAPGIYFDLPEAIYHADPALSCSGMKYLAISPLNYWHRHLNPNYTGQEESDAQRFGKAMHCRLLEPDRFQVAYATELSIDDYPDALVTDEDLKEWLVGHNLPTGGKRKQERIDRILDLGLPAIIWDIEKGNHAEATEGMTLLKKAESTLLDGAASVIAADPYASAALTGGIAEVSFFVRDPESGVMLKARMDYVKPTAKIDLKTFSNSRGKLTDKVIFDAIYYEGYYLQCVVYHTIRELARYQLAAGEIQTHGFVPEGWLKGFTENEHHGFGFVFIESAEPFDLRLVFLRRSEAPGAEPNVYWQAAAMKLADLTALFADCQQRFGDSPWRDPAQPHVLADTDLPQLMFA